MPPTLAEFRRALEAVCDDLAQQIVNDGEGARKFVTIGVTGADSDGRPGASVYDRQFTAGEDGDRRARTPSGDGSSWRSARQASSTDVLARDPYRRRPGSSQDGGPRPRLRRDAGAVHGRAGPSTSRSRTGRPGRRRCGRRSDHRYIDINAITGPEPGCLASTPLRPTPPIVLVAAVALSTPMAACCLPSRPAGKTLAGLWEFPGGKVAPARRPGTAAVRELREEIGDRHHRKLPCALHLRHPCLRRLPFADAAFRLPRWRGIPDAARRAGR